MMWSAQPFLRLGKTPRWTVVVLSWDSETLQIGTLITELIHQLLSTWVAALRIADADVALSAKELWAAQLEQAHKAASGRVANFCFWLRIFW